MIWWLLFVYQVKHFICDYPLQGKYMLGKFKGGTEWVLPLASHALVHAAVTFLIVLACGKPELAWLAFLDGTIHFLVDRVKASPHMLGRFKDMYHPYFWWALGWDQMMHHLTHYFIIYTLLFA